MAKVTHDNADFVVECEFFDLRAKQAPERKWDTKRKVWVLPMVEVNAQYIRRQFGASEVDPVTNSIVDNVLAVRERRESRKFPGWYEFKNKPMAHQSQALDAVWSRKAFALFMEMGTGKTFVSINWASALAQDGEIQGLLVFCPTSVKPVWKHEMATHCPMEHNVFILEAGGTQKFDKWMAEEVKGLRVLVVGIEALSQGKGFAVAQEFAIKHQPAMVIDESSRIKTPTSKRTKKCWDLAEHAPYKMILTGTPITQGMQDLFAQYRFLDWKIIGQKSYFSFQNRYCIMGGFEGRAIVGYSNVAELMDLVAENTFIVKKDEVLDLPPKVYEKITVEPNPAQKRVFKELGDQYVMASTMGDLTLEVETILERMTRYQQVAGGLFPYDNEDGTHGVTRIEGKNPKLEALMEQIDIMDDSRKVIIWARFKEEQAMITERLRETYGWESLAWYGADSTTSERSMMIDEFQNSSHCRFFLSNPAMGGIGLTLTAATYVIYYSNSFSLEDRLQSEDRAHRKGQSQSVTYIDLVMNHKIDSDIATALKKKQSVAQYVETQIKESQK